VSNTPVSHTPTDEQFPVAGEPEPAEPVEAIGYDAPKKGGKGKLITGVVVGLAAVAVAVFALTRSSGPSEAVVPAATAPLIADSAAVQPAAGAVTTPPVAAAESAATVAPKPDSQAVADSLKRIAAARKAKADSLKRVAKADSIKKAVAAAAAADSVKRSQQTSIARARSAVGALLSNAAARKQLTDGATHMGGVLGTKRLGDLQTQINALQPFLRQAGLSYEQFKGLAAESGIKVYDEFGRMVPDSLRRFAGVR
jgi:hypothetical protein